MTSKCDTNNSKEKTYNALQREQFQIKQNQRSVFFHEMLTQWTSNDSEITHFTDFQGRACELKYRAYGFSLNKQQENLL